MKRSGTTLLEILIGLIILVMVIAIIIPLINLAEQQEAERLATQAIRAVPVANATVAAESGTKRFSAAFHGEFHGGYDNNIRHIFVITDHNTGIEYLSITGCGTSELVSVSDGKNRKTVEQ